MTIEECYQTLGVSIGASQDEIHKAHKKKVFETHPDKNNGNDKEFLRVQEAYEILSGKQKPQRQSFDSPDVNINDIFGSGFDPFKEFFSHGFGFSSTPPQQQQFPEHDKDVQINFSMTAEDVRQGRTMKVKFQKAKKCDKCNGMRAREKHQCSVCNGLGQVRREQRNGGMIFVNTSQCPQCFGIGCQLIDPCRKCEATGFIVYQDQMIIEIKEKR